MTFGTGAEILRLTFLDTVIRPRHRSMRTPIGGPPGGNPTSLTPALSCTTSGTCSIHTPTTTATSRHLRVGPARVPGSHSHLSVGVSVYWDAMSGKAKSLNSLNSKAKELARNMNLIHYAPKIFGHRRSRPRASPHRPRAAPLVSGARTNPLLAVNLHVHWLLHGSWAH